MNKQNLECFLNTHKEQKGFHYTGLQSSINNRRIQKRVTKTNMRNCEIYQEYLEKNPDEIYRLIFSQLI